MLFNYQKKIKIFDKFIVEDVEFKKAIDAILDFIPCKNGISYVVFDKPNLLSYFTDPNKKEYLNIRNSLYCK